MRIGLVYNLRTDHPDLATGPVDVFADWDVAEPMAELRDGLRRTGHEVVDVGDPHRLLAGDLDLDLVFNVAEMTGYRYREALVPSLLELLGIPYTFAAPDGMVLTLDKNVSNLLVRQAGGPVADWTIARSADDVLLHRFLDEHAGARFLVKPVAEGSSMGITKDAVCDTPAAVRRLVRASVETYAQPALVQLFLAGRELTCAVVEVDGRPQALGPIEIESGTGEGSELFDFDRKEALGDEVVECFPLHAGDPLYGPAQEISVLAFAATGCRDVARVDLRCAAGSEGLSFLEINALPGLDPLSAEAMTDDYDALLEAIVASAMRRAAALAGARRPA
ncbi:MAG: D-alanine-D-alanine ligase [Solirubrobacteraceae bacterium]|nr:D-alanine-D-alanine ligase [Solirubrobacteraceae bacterium]